MIVKMFQSLENRVEKMQAPINAMNMALDKIETNNTITKIKNTLEETNSIISEAEEWTSELEDRKVEITADEQNKAKRMKRTENRLRDFWDSIKHTNNWIIGVLEEEEKNRRSEKMFEEIIVENFPNMGKEIFNQVQEV